MKKTITATLLAMGLLVGLGTSAPTAQAATTPDKVITIDGNKPARFDHAVHLRLGVSCGQCHHDASHQPLDEAAIKAMAEPGNLHCETCHKQDFANAKLRQRKDIFHARCKECHQQGVAGKKGPTSCNACHLSKPRKAVEGC